MKVLFTISSLQSGGAERVLSTLANYWSRKGWDITILVVSSKNRFYKIDENIKIISLLDNYKSSSSKLQILYYIKGIRETIKSEKPDIVISFITLMNILVLLATRGLNVPILISERNYFDQLRKKSLKVLRRVLYPKSSAMVVLSEYDYNKYDYVDSKKIIFNPLNIENILDVNIDNKEKILIAVGSLSYQKGFSMLIEALSKIDFKGWKFLIIGEGSLREELEELIREYNLEDNVYLIGKKSNIFDYYKKASIFVLSSLYEGFPNVLAEAMAHGCASVAFDCKTGPSEMINDGVNGYLVEANNIDLLSKRIESLIDNGNIRKKFSEESLKIKEKLELNKITAIWESYIVETIKSQKG
ncbi:Alpha-1,4-N-acetylgalactosamine transferase PglH [hydrothermal vent metagenome]|uniref:Alpha-1,4-N-acetylgalactosamine transferase PglH n=1 Tax=hydrothermal vent metagenome TaxID=652676 RepID=A0A1W1CBL7_9ZZZZ